MFVADTNRIRLLPERSCGRNLNVTIGWIAWVFIAIEWLAGNVETVSTAAEVRRIAAALPEPFRWMLTTVKNQRAASGWQEVLQRDQLSRLNRRVSTILKTNVRNSSQPYLLSSPRLRLYRA
jgi:hypothetical protein